MGSENKKEGSSERKNLLTTRPAGSELRQALVATEGLRQRVQSILAPYNSIIHSAPAQSVFQIGSAYANLAKQPELVRVGSVVQSLQNSSFMAAAERVGAIGRLYQEQLERICSPMQQVSAVAESIFGIIKLQTIGELVRMPASIGPDISRALRDEFGDWRDAMVFREGRSSSRAEFYADVGFDLDLIDFPDNDFPVIIEQTGIVPPITEIEQVLGSIMPDEYPIPKTSDELELLAYKWLRALERAVRDALDRVMTDTFGSNWPSVRLPNGMVDDWQAKRERAQAAGRPDLALVEFADFSDYSRIILRRDNWKEVFSKLWAREADVRESFQRLQYIRIETMHSRILLKQDLILLFSEGRRLFQALAKLQRRE